MRILLATFFTLLCVTTAFPDNRLVFALPDDEFSFVSLSILKEAYARIGYDVEGRVLPAGRALAESDNGYTDGEVNRIAAIEGAHPNLIRIAAPLHRFEGMAFTCDDSIVINGWESLRGLRIGIRSGMRYAELATKNIPRVHKAQRYETLFDMLTQGRLDVVVAYRGAVRNVPKNDESCPRMHTPPLADLELFHYLHRRHAGVAPDITRSLQELLASDAYERLFNRALQMYRARTR